MADQSPSVDNSSSSNTNSSDSSKGSSKPDAVVWVPYLSIICVVGVCVTLSVSFITHWKRVKKRRRNIQDYVDLDIDLRRKRLFGMMRMPCDACQESIPTSFDYSASYDLTHPSNRPESQQMRNQYNFLQYHHQHYSDDFGGGAAGVVGGRLGGAFGGGFGGSPLRGGFCSQDSASGVHLNPAAIGGYYGIGGGNYGNHNHLHQHEGHRIISPTHSIRGRQPSTCNHHCLRSCQVCWKSFQDELCQLFDKCHVGCNTTASDNVDRNWTDLRKDRYSSKHGDHDEAEKFQHLSNSNDITSASNNNEKERSAAYQTHSNYNSINADDTYPLRGSTSISVNPDVNTNQYDNRVHYLDNNTNRNGNVHDEIVVEKYDDDDNVDIPNNRIKREGYSTNSLKKQYALDVMHEPINLQSADTNRVNNDDNNSTSNYHSGSYTAEVGYIKQDQHKTSPRISSPRNQKFNHQFHPEHYGNPQPLFLPRNTLNKFSIHDTEEMSFDKNGQQEAYFKRAVASGIRENQSQNHAEAQSPYISPHSVTFPNIVYNNDTHQRFNQHDISEPILSSSPSSNRGGVINYGYHSDAHFESQGENQNNSLSTFTGEAQTRKTPSFGERSAYYNENKEHSSSRINTNNSNNNNSNNNIDNNTIGKKKRPFIKSRKQQCSSGNIKNSYSKSSGNNNHNNNTIMTTTESPNLKLDVSTLPNNTMEGVNTSGKTYFIDSSNISSSSSRSSRSSFVRSSLNQYPSTNQSSQRQRHIDLSVIELQTDEHTKNGYHGTGKHSRNAIDDIHV